MSASRIGNVAGIVLKPAAGPSPETAVNSVESDLRQIFVDVRCVDAARGPVGFEEPSQSIGKKDGSSATWASVFGEIAEDRVLLATGDASRYGAEVLLALTAWPERDAVLLVENSDREPTAWIFRREPVLEALRRPGLAVDDLEIERLDLTALGFDSNPNDRRPDASPAAPNAGGR